MSVDEDDRKTVRAEFKDAVNMTPKELDRWLGTDDSKSVGQKDGDAESTGHAMGRRIIEIAARNQSELSDDDYAAMKKVAGYAARHLKQGGPEDESKIGGSRWRFSLMNWGHDPLK